MRLVAGPDAAATRSPTTTSAAAGARPTRWTARSCSAPSSSVCQAIGYAHSRGVIHRDLKPENVVLGGFGEVIVLDWGLAKMVDQPDEPADDGAVTLSESVAPTRRPPRRQGQLGTPAYMAPEQAEGRLDLIDARTDIYGLGAILFEILTGRRRTTGPTPPRSIGRSFTVRPRTSALSSRRLRHRSTPSAPAPWPTPTRPLRRGR